MTKDGESRMSDEELAAIRARAEAGVPGPWSAWEAYRSDTEDLVSVRVGDAYWTPDSFDYQLNLPISERRKLAMRDAQFIAHAREDIPALLAEVERLRPFEAQALAQRIQILQWESRLATTESAIDEHERSIPRIVAFNDHLVAEVERLRAENAALRERGMQT